MDDIKVEVGFEDVVDLSDLTELGTIVGQMESDDRDMWSATVIMKFDVFSYPTQKAISR